MRQSKAATERDGVARWTNRANGPKPARMSTEAARDRLFRSIERALAGDEFEPAYQPVARLADGALAGFEALARWRRASETVVEPSVFLAEARARNLMDGISRRILLAACATLRGWRQDGVAGLYVAVNATGREIERTSFVEDTLAVVRAAELEPGSLRLEVTEQEELLQPEIVARHLGLLREAGIKVLFDDFGSGFSSFTWLTQLPADAIKFDQSLVAGVTRAESRERKILRAMIGLAHDLGLETVAEGVETQDQSDALADLGCDYGQGHLFAPPLAATDARALIGKLRNIP